MYQNPIELYVNGNRVNIGDPFILKFNGIYYLYYSTDSDKKGIGCFSSTDLVDWMYQGIICDNDITFNAYAPEVIYYRNQFLLITSPSGNGHYIFKSKLPLGPFELVTDNLKNMIDGSFYKENNRLYVTRANHKGITLHKIDEKYKFKNKLDLEAELFGWTEGPFIIKRKDIYYLTYCGNHLVSDGYRVEYSYANDLSGPYKKGINNPLLVSVKDDYKALGHSSIVIGPDLDTYYNVYHKLSKKEKGFLRDYCVDKLDFNGCILKQNITNTLINRPDRPMFESYEDDHKKKFQYFDNLMVTPTETMNKFTAEINFSNYNNLQIFFGIKDNKKYIISFDNSMVIINRTENNLETLIMNEKVEIDLSKINKITLKQENQFELFLNDQLLFTSSLIANGKIGFLNYKENYIGYVAFSDKAYENVSGHQVAPGLIFINSAKKAWSKSNKFYINLLNANEQINEKVSGVGEFLISAFIETTSDAKIKLSVNKEEKIIHVKFNDSPYKFSKFSFMKTNLHGEHNVNIKVLEGKINIVYMHFERLFFYEKEVSNQDNIFKETYNLYNPINLYNRFETQIKIIENHTNSRYGLIVNATEFSDFEYQCKFPLIGYFIGFYNNLLVIDKLQYGISRLYDIPFVLDKNICKLSTIIKKNKICVYIDDRLMMECYDNHIKNTGQYGTYSNELCNINFEMTKGGIYNV